MTAFEAVGRGSIPRWGTDLSLGCDGGTRLCEGRRPGSTPGRDIDLMTLKPHGVVAACKTASSGFDSHRRLDTTDCAFGIHLHRLRLNHNLAGRVLGQPQLPVGTTSPW